MAAPAPNARSSQKAFKIPEEYRDQLEYVELKDTRLDEEILSQWPSSELWPRKTFGPSGTLAC